MRSLTYLVLALVPLCVAGQNAAQIRGTITDQSGALVPEATVTLTGTAPRTTSTASDGTYSFSGLAPGHYALSVSATGLAMPRPLQLTVKAGIQTVNVELRLATLTEKLTVNDVGTPAVAADPSSNAGAIVLRGTDLDALADDPTNLEADLQALAGPAAGPNGGAIFIDGFSGGQIPSKDAIREIRINQNPFSPEYDRIGLGRIEILTKPGADHYRGSIFYNFANDAWNSRNPYAAEKAPFLLHEFGGNIGGPLGKKASFFADVRRDSTDNGAILNGVILDPASLTPSPYTDVYRVRQRATRFSPRLDYQVNQDNTLTVRYAFLEMNIPGAGVGSFNLVPRGYNASTVSHAIQVGDTTVVSPSVINELRFQYYRYSVTDRPTTAAPAIDVNGSFNGGGSTLGNSRDMQNSYEFQENVSWVKGTHTIRFGARLRGLQEQNFSPDNFNGTFTFSGGPGITSIEQYRRTLLHQATPSQFTIVSGNPDISAGQFDAGLFFGDDWRIRPNLTLSLGARYERQTNIRDWTNFAPRVSLAWGIGGAKAKTVIRAGSGIFYDRFVLGYTINAMRYTGLQRQYIFTNPTFFPDVPTTSALENANSSQIVEKVSSNLRAPYMIQSAFAVERQLPWRTTASLTYANTHGLHLLRSRNVNAPLLGSGEYPYGAVGPIFLMESAGLYNQHQLILNVNSKINNDVSLIGSYMLNSAKANTDGANTFPANQYDLSTEYGPAATDIRNRFSLAGSVNTRWDVRLSPLIVVQSGPPFDITTGRDLFGTTLFNARPGLALDPNQPGVISTPYGLLDPNPKPGEALLTRNYGRGPGTINFNLRVSKTIPIGPVREASAAAAAQGSTSGRGVGGGVFSSGGVFSANPVARRYNLVISMQALNLLNHNNPGPIIGSITSPLFGQANQPAGARDLGGGGFSESANNRRLELQVRFNF